MKKTKPQFYEEFNNKDSIIIVSPFPTYKDSKMKNITGVSTYTYNLVNSIYRNSKSASQKLIILSDISDNSKPKSLKNLLVIPTWDKKTLNPFYKIQQNIDIFENANKILVHFEFNMYGGIINTLLFPYFLFKNQHKNITLVLHQVAEDISSLGGHIGIFNNVTLKFYDFFYKLFFKSLLFPKTKIIVHDKILKTRIINFGCKNDIFVIPHGLGEFKTEISETDARKKLGLKSNDFILLIFGFVAWYKGTDLIVDKIKEFSKKNPNSNIKLIIAGGESFNLKDKPHYQKYYQNFLQQIENVPEIIHTGFIENKKVPLYFSASDLVIFPYRTLMSSSGPFAICLSFQKPFLLAESLVPMLDTGDIKQIMEEYNIKKSDISFKILGNDLFKKLTLHQEDTQKIRKISRLSKKVSKIRNWEIISQLYLKIINTNL